MKRKPCLREPFLGAVLLLNAASALGGCTMGTRRPSDQPVAASAAPQASLLRADIGGGTDCDSSLASADGPVLPPSTEWGSGDLDFAPTLIIGLTSDRPGVTVRTGVIETSHDLEPR